MTEERFVADRTPRWAELRELLARAQLRGLGVLTGKEVRRLGALYRSATTDLATARSLRFSEATLLHVNRLCVAAHDIVYAGHRGGERKGRVVRFLTGGFPALVRRTWRFHAAAALLSIASGVVAFVVFRNDPDLAERTLGTVFRERAERAAALPDDERRYLEIPDLYAPVFSWGLMSHNVFVTLVAFAAGVLTGLGTLFWVFLLVWNGVSLGGGLAVFHDAGVPGVIWTFIAAHGPIELTAVFIAAGAGMRIGLSLLLPGRRSRAAAFRETGMESVTLLLGTSVMLVIAGLIEGFLSPSAAPAPVKWAVGGASIVFLAWYFSRAGRLPASLATRGTASHPS